MKILLLGINHAGTSAARTLLALDKEKKHQLVAYDRQKSISFLGCGIALSVSGVVKKPTDLFYCTPNKLENMGAEIHMGYEAISVDTTKKEVVVKHIETGETKTESYDKLIYACGSQPIPSNAKNSDLKNVIVCKTYTHAVKLKEDAGNPEIKSVAIIGAGYIGIELAEAFASKGKEVHIVEARERILFNNVDHELAGVIHKELTKNNVLIHLNEKVVEYEADGEKLVGLKTDKQTIKVDLVVESIGIRPNTQLLSGVDKIANGSIKVDAKAKSSNPDIYVLGDAAAIYSAAARTHQNIALATNAVKTGIVAAADLVGVEPVRLDSITGTNALCVFNKKIATTGLTFVQAEALGMNAGEIFHEDTDLPTWMETNEKVCIKVVYDKDSMRLLGAQILSYDKNNHSEWILALSLAIQQSLTLFQIATSDVYFLPHLNKPFNFVLSAILKILGLNYFEE